MSKFFFDGGYLPRPLASSCTSVNNCYLNSLVGRTFSLVFLLTIPETAFPVFCDMDAGG